MIHVHLVLINTIFRSEFERSPKAHGKLLLSNWYLLNKNSYYLKFYYILL